MSKLTKLLRDPRQFVLDSKAYRRALFSVRRLGRGEPARASLSLDSLSHSQELTIALVDDLARAVPILEIEPGRVAVLRSDQAALSEYLLDLGRSEGFKIELSAAPAAVTAGASLFELDEFLGNAEVVVVTLEARPSGRVLTLDVELWRTDELQVVGPASNRPARRITHQTVEEYGLFRKGALRRARELHPCTLSTDTKFPVDIVYTWVNHRDPHWQALWQAHVGKLPKAAGEESTSLDRFMNRDELLYSLRSVARYAPWYRRIFILSNCQRPSWLGNHPDVVWVDHREVIPAECLPTFSSHAIETRLHHIPGLADHFLYLNDDVFLLRPTSASDFFEGNGMAKSFMEEYGSVSGAVRAEDPDYLNAARNGKRLLEEVFGRSVTQLHKHTAMALRKDLLQEIEERFAEPIRRTTAQRLRSSNDISLVSFLYHHYAYLTCRGVFAESDALLIKPRTPLYEEWLGKLLSEQERPVTVCLNDGGGSVARPDWDRRIAEFLEAAFPWRSKFELGAPEAAPRRDERAGRCPLCQHDHHHHPHVERAEREVASSL
jgi:hypothetical protein